MNRSFFFEDQVYDWGWFKENGSHIRTKITPKLPPREHDTDVYFLIPCPLHISFTFEGFSITEVQLYWLVQVANDLCISNVHYHELHEKLTPKIIILDAEISNLPTRKLQPVNAYMFGTRNNFEKNIRLHFNCEYFSVHVLYTCKLVKCHHVAFHQGMHCLLR